MAGNASNWYKPNSGPLKGQAVYLSKAQRAVLMLDDAGGRGRALDLLESGSSVVLAAANRQRPAAAISSARIETVEGGIKPRAGDKAEQITITVGAPGNQLRRLRVQAIVQGGVALHKSIDDDSGFSLSGAKSGLLAGWAATEEQGREALRRLDAAKLDWDRLSSTGADDPEQQRALKVIRELTAEGVLEDIGRRRERLSAASRRGADRRFANERAAQSNSRVSQLITEVGETPRHLTNPERVALRYSTAPTKLTFERNGKRAMVLVNQSAPNKTAKGKVFVSVRNADGTTQSQVVSIAKLPNLLEQLSGYTPLDMRAGGGYGW